MPISKNIVASRDLGSLAFEGKTYWVVTITEHFDGKQVIKLFGEDGEKEMVYMPRNHASIE